MATAPPIEINRSIEFADRMVMAVRWPVATFRTDRYFICRASRVEQQILFEWPVQFIMWSADDGAISDERGEFCTAVHCLWITQTDAHKDNPEISRVATAAMCGHFGTYPFLFIAGARRNFRIS